jgi:hypothetical protein
MNREGSGRRFSDDAGGEVFLVYAMKAYRECKGIATLILNLGNRWK